MKLKDSLNYAPKELAFGTSGLRGLVTDMTDLECYINVSGFVKFLEKSQKIPPTQKFYIAGDLRESTPRIMGAVQKALVDAGYEVENAGEIPTPAIAYYAATQQSPCIMVTGSHIPADRNGIKFYKTDGEVLKPDEAPIKEAVAAVRQVQYDQESEESLFDASGTFKSSVAAQTVADQAAETYAQRYLTAFSKDCLTGKKIVFYQHSAVGRDQLSNLLEQLGATVIRVGRSDTFIPIDSENVTPENETYFQELAQENPGLFAIVSTDGDSDRPFVVDETGNFHRGDIVGAVTASWLKADYAAYPVSTSDAVDTFLSDENIPSTHTRIGSPYVIEAMNRARDGGASRVVGWEVNGGFLLGTDITLLNGRLEALPTRDAFLPILVSLVAAAEANTSLSALFSGLPQRFTGAGLIDNFPNEVSAKIVQRFSQDSPDVRKQIAEYFVPEDGFGSVGSINTVDGIRITFDNGEIAHLRPSGNAPQLRIYSVADTKRRADEIVALAIKDQSGVFRRIEQAIGKG